MPFWEKEIFGNPAKTWLLAFILAVLVWLIWAVVTKVLAGRLKARASKTATPVDDMIVRLLGGIKGIVPFAVSLYAGGYVLALPARVSVIIGKIVILAALAQAAVWGTSAISFWVERRRLRETGDEAAARATLTGLAFLARLVLWSALILLAFDNLGVKVTTLLAGLGVGGVAVALAVQNILGDLFASLSIILDKPFVIGDLIVIDDFRGTIEHIGLKTTRVRSLSGEQLIFANSDLLKSRIRNFKRMAERRVVLTLGVVYQTPAEKLEALPRILREIIESRSGARFERAHFSSFGAYALDFEVVYWILSPDYARFMDIQQAVNLAVFRRFQEEGIAFAYPTRRILLSKEIH
ncbi:MAG: mechanosensitive ion channel family protein [Candidatus Aminicenantes bacterium]|nr:mechanosensitive ion channel family protein [Candidatus Aminicenantes bacterium]